MIIYGIKNCDSVKKAINYLNERNIVFEFVDFKKEKIQPQILENAISQLGVNKIINKRSNTYRNLTQELKEKIEKQEEVIQILIDNPNLIKRPLIFDINTYYCGFNKPDFDSNF